MKNYIVFVRDHSGSMNMIRTAACVDFNATVESVKSLAISQNQDTIVSVVELGGDVRVPIRNSSVAAIQPLMNYSAAGGTPLFSAVDQAIALCEAVPDANDPDVSFLVYVTTDGQETEKPGYGKILGEKIRKLWAGDRWTFAFRVPRGMAKGLVALGIPEGNVIEWDQSERGMREAQAQATVAMQSFYTARSVGQKSTKTFFAGLSNVSPSEVKTKLQDITGRVMLWPVSEAEDGKMIRDFVEARLGEPMKMGGAFYQLTKTENRVQGDKRICVRDNKSKMVYTGDAARTLLGLPQFVEVRVKPEDLGNFDVFIQSQSVNRKLVKGTEVLYWKEAGA